MRAGMIGWWPSRAVTFVDNHDTGSTQAHWPFPQQSLHQVGALCYCCSASIGSTYMPTSHAKPSSHMALQAFTEPGRVALEHMCMPGNCGSHPCGGPGLKTARASCVPLCRATRTCSHTRARPASSMTTSGPTACSSPACGAASGASHGLFGHSHPGPTCLHRLIPTRMPTCCLCMHLGAWPVQQASVHGPCGTLRVSS